MSKVYFPIEQWSSRYGKSIFSFNTQTHQLCQPEVACCLPHVEYEITIYCGRDSWTVCKRFSQFYTLIADLKEHHSHDELGELPRLPGKTWFPIVYDEYLLTTRREKLRLFLDDLLLKLNQKKLSSDPIILAFFGFSNTVN